MEVADQLVIGDYSYIDQEPIVLSWGEPKYKVTIGKFCSIARGVTFVLQGEHEIGWVTTYPFPLEVDEWKAGSKKYSYKRSKGDIEVANDVWIGFGATILSGVHIGNGAVIGARAVVSKNVPPYAIVAGNPAKIVKYRFNTKVIDRLLKEKWWNWPKQEIIDNMDYLINKP
jgi:acetyltransferase-like isoleucine patch superfamily enzyme